MNYYYKWKIIRYDNAYAEICNDNDKSIPCPDLIVLNTSQVIKIINSIIFFIK